MGGDSEMAGAARRLRAAFLGANPGRTLPDGASNGAVEALEAGFPGLHVPGELGELLRVLNGSGADWILAGMGPLLAVEFVVAESRDRAAIAEEVAFCPGWVVFSSEGWSHAAVVAQAELRDRSSVLDLSYGNQGYPVAASSLTALVAASADAWESGVHEDSAMDGSADGQSAAVNAYQTRQDLLAERSGDFPSDDGLTAGDTVGFWRAAWPVWWPGRDAPDLISLYAATSLADALGSLGAHSVIDVTVTETRGRRVRVYDDTAEGWLDVPPGLAAGHLLAEGARHLFSVLHAAAAWLPSSEPPTLHVTGIYST